jgi:hypothetical protein
MKEERLAQKIGEQASKFKLRAAKSPEDNKRHDLVKPDERRAMHTAYRKLGWSYAKIASIFGRDPRTVKLCVQEEQRILTKREEYQQEIERHRKELSHAALAIASNLERYRNPLTSWKNPDQIGELAYGGTVYEILPSPLNSGQIVELEKVDKDMALNLFAHVGAKFPELADIKDWTELTNDKITDDFINRLRLQAYLGNFKGKCKACPN